MVHADTTSTKIISRWEKEQSCSVLHKKHKRSVLESIIKACGLGVSKWNKKQLRTLLESLKRHALPTCPEEVDRALTITYNQPITGMLLVFVIDYH